MAKLNWASLNDRLPKLTEKQVWTMLQTELETYRRTSYLTRLHQRYCALRDAREREEILARALER
jgi:hypothetical protein